MSANFKYPDKPPSVEKEDWNRLERSENGAQAKTAPPADENKKEKLAEARRAASAHDPNSEQSLNRLMALVKKHLLNRPDSKDPEKNRKRRAISAYQKAAAQKKAA